MSRVLLLVDLSNQAYKAAAVHPTLTSGDTYTGGLYGVLGALAKGILEVKATHVIVCGDSPPYVRKSEFPEYKAGRTALTPADEFFHQNAVVTKALVLEFLGVVGIPVWFEPGYEYDDLCAAAVVRLRNRFRRIVAMSNDSDLYQLFDYDCFEVYRGKKGTYTRSDFSAEYGGLSSAQWVQLLSLTGTHNAVPGVRGIGEKTALKAIRGDPYSLRKILAQHSDVVERNKQLITLPHPAFGDRAKNVDAVLASAKPCGMTRAVLRWVSRYDISATQMLTDALEQLT